MNQQLEIVAVVDEMLLALSANIEFLKQEGGSQILVKNGEFIDDVGGVFIYEFKLDFLQEIIPDTEIDVRIHNRNISGKVISSDGKKIQIQLEKNIGVKIPEARLIISSYYLLQLLHDKLVKFKKGEIKFTDLAPKIFGLQNSNVGLDEDYTFSSLVLSKRERPNEYQERAIRQALGSETLFVWGPPGTGKTITIAQIIEGFIEKGLSVLLLAHTNVATDGAFGDFVEIKVNEESPDYHKGLFIRIGDVTPKSKLSGYEMVSLDNIEAKLASPIKEEIDSLKIKAKEHQDALVSHQKILANFMKLASIKSDIETIVDEIRKKVLENQGYENQEIALKKTIDDIEKRILNFQSLGRFGRFFSGDNLENLSRTKTQIILQTEENSLYIRAAKRMIERGEEEDKRLSDELGKVLSLVSGKNEKNEKEIYDIEKRNLDNIEEQIVLLTKQLGELRISLIKDAKVISTTLTKSYSDKSVLNREYDCVIVDEASMAPLPALWCAMGLAKKKAVVVGDFYQLPPVVKHRVLKEKKSNEEVIKEELLIKNWLSRDIFETVGITKAISEGNNPSNLVQLKIQYRMHPEIADVINTLVYSKGGNKFALESAESTRLNGSERLDKEPLVNSHIGVYDTSEIKTFVTRTDSGSYFNIYNAILCTELASQALKSGYKDVGIVCPFRPQANLIQKVLIDKKIDDLVAVDTVHRFQGGQKQLIIFDTVTAQPTKLTDDNSVGGDDEKLINVAFSRAQEKCMVVADVPAILKKHSESSLFRKYLQFCSDKGIVVRSTQGILSNFSLIKETEQWLREINDVNKLNKELNNSELYDQTDFYKRFIKDLLEAKVEVIIDSPYITEERMKMFYPIFHFILQKGVKIFILTRTTEEHSDQMKMFAEDAIRKMDKMGIVILPFKGQIHRKLSIIDRKIIWEGSLNILSQRDSQEFMRRLDGTETSKQLIKFLNIEKNLGTIGSLTLEKCEFCEEPGAWYWTEKSRFGMWKHCLVGMHKPGTPPKSKEEIREKKKALTKARKMKKQLTEDGTPICSEHDLPMILKKGRWGDFWGCQKYPRCRITEKV